MCVCCKATSFSLRYSCIVALLSNCTQEESGFSASFICTELRLGIVQTAKLAIQPSLFLMLRTPWWKIHGTFANGLLEIYLRTFLSATHCFSPELLYRPVNLSGSKPLMFTM